MTTNNESLVIPTEEISEVEATNQLEQMESEAVESMNPKVINLPRMKFYNPLEGIDIEEEFKLIGEKKSKLSRRLRDLVVSIHPSFLEWKQKKEEKKDELPNT